MQEMLESVAQSLCHEVRMCGDGTCQYGSRPGNYNANPLPYTLVSQKLCMDLRKRRLEVGGRSLALASEAWAWPSLAKGGRSRRNETKNGALKTVLNFFLLGFITLQLWFQDVALASGCRSVIKPPVPDLILREELGTSRMKPTRCFPGSSVASLPRDLESPFFSELGELK